MGDLARGVRALRTGMRDDGDAEPGVPRADPNPG
jgi:hypothetical protein